MANEAKQFTIGGVTHDVMDVGARQAITSLRNAIDAITSGDTTTAIKTFQEVINFLDGVTDDATLIGKLNELRTLIASKVDTSDLAEVATSGSYNDLENKPTIPTVPTNVSSFNNDAGYLTQHQSLAGRVQSNDVVSIVKITQAAYDALQVKDSSTLYLITES